MSQKISSIIGFLVVMLSFVLSLQIKADEKPLPGGGYKDAYGHCLCGGGDCRPCNFQ